MARKATPPAESPQPVATPEPDPQVRLALQRIRGRRPKTAATEATSAAKRARATKAVLGLLDSDQTPSTGAGAAPVDLAAQLARLTPAQRQQMARLLQGARTQDDKPPSARTPQPDPAEAMLGKIEQDLADRGVKLLVRAGSVTININSPQSGAPGASGRVNGGFSGRAPPRRVSGFNSWGRRCARIRDFLMGH